MNLFDPNTPNYAHNMGLIQGGLGLLNAPVTPYKQSGLQGLGHGLQGYMQGNMGAQQQLAAQKQQQFDNEMKRKQVEQTAAYRKLQMQKAQRELNGKHLNAPVWGTDENGKSVLLSPSRDRNTGDGTLKPFDNGGYTLTDPATRERNIVRGRAEAERIQDAITKGGAAADGIRDINKMIDINKRITTGGYVAAKKYVSDLFGTTTEDIGEFDALGKQMVLGQIRQLGANPTEGERAFLERAAAGLKQGSKVNNAILKRLRQVYIRQINDGVLGTQGIDPTKQKLDEALNLPDPTATPDPRQQRIDELTKELLHGR